MVWRGLAHGSSPRHTIQVCWPNYTDEIASAIGTVAFQITTNCFLVDPCTKRIVGIPVEHALSRYRCAGRPLVLVKLGRLQPAAHRCRGRRTGSVCGRRQVQVQSAGAGLLELAKIRATREQMADLYCPSHTIQVCWPNYTVLGRSVRSVFRSSGGRVHSSPENRG